LTTWSFFPESHLRHIYSYFVKNHHIVDISGCDKAGEYLHSIDMMKMLIKGDPHWENCVPQKVKELIKGKHLFGFK